MHEHSTPQQSKGKPHWLVPSLLLLAVGGIALALVLGAPLWIIFFAGMLLIHGFMHLGHGGHGRSGEDSEDGHKGHRGC